MEEWISLKEFMRRNHMGYEKAIVMLNSGKVEYQKVGNEYKIKVNNSPQSIELMENLIRENEELKTTLKNTVKTIQGILEQVEV